MGTRGYLLLCNSYRSHYLVGGASRSSEKSQRPRPSEAWTGHPSDWDGREVRATPPRNVLDTITTIVISHSPQLMRFFCGEYPKNLVGFQYCPAIPHHLVEGA
jgi:hypothetical protein